MGEAVLLEHCPHPSEQQSQSAERRSVQKKCEKSRLDSELIGTQIQKVLIPIVEKIHLCYARSLYKTKNLFIAVGVCMTKQATQTNLKPLGNRILVKRLESEEKVKGGIILPDTAKKKQETATVIALGTGKKDKGGVQIPFPVKVGDKILMEKYSGQEVTLDGEEFIILRSDDIIAIVE
jgi:chaperonin GroES